MFGLGYNKEKSRAAAEKYLQQNKLQNAITEYEKILAAEPKDLAIMNTVGDVYARLGQNEKAIERFRVIGESYVADGSILKAIAMYKKITKLDPNGLPAMEKLSELYRKQGLVSDARSMLLQTAEAYTRKGQSKESLRLLKQLVLFDPENVQVITRTADLMIQGGQKTEAKQMLAQTASTLIDRRALNPAQKILERLISLDASNMRAREMRAQVVLELGDAAKAIEIFESIPDMDSRADGLRNLLTAYLNVGNLDEAFLVCRKLVSVHNDSEGILKVAARLYKENDTVRAISLYSEFPTQALAQDREDVLAHLHGAVSRVRNNPDALQTLYNLFRQAGESSMNAEILELQAHACVQSEQFERARDAYKELIELEPENVSHIQGYRQVCARLGVAAPLTPSANLPPDVAARPDDTPQTLEEFRADTAPDLPTQSYNAQIQEEIDAALSEAELCESFSSKKRGITALERALVSVPEDLVLNRTLGLLYQQEGEASKAAHCYRTIHRVLEGMGEIEAAAYYASLCGTEQTTTWEAKSSEFTARDFDLSASSDLVGGTAEEIDLSSEWESVWQDASLEASPAAAPPNLAPAAPAQPPASNIDIQDLVDEVRFCLDQQIWSEAESGIARLANASPHHPELPALCNRLRSARPDSTVLPVLPTPPADDPLYAQIEVIELGGELDDLLIDAPPSPPVAAPNLSSLAAELDFELGESFIPASHQPSAPPMSAAPPPPPIAAPPIAAAPIPTPEPFPAAVPQAPPPDASFAAPAAAGANAFMPPSPRPPVPSPFMPPPPEAPADDMLLSSSVFGDLLQDFENDLAAPQDDSGDPETHFNLGIAFREMGLLDEAIGELQKVCRLAGNGITAARTQQAYIWLATCFVEKSVPEASLKWFLRALEAAPDEESRTAVNYELASAYEAAGHKNEALSHFMEVYGNNIDYRDVASRIRDLRASV